MLRRDHVAPALERLQEARRHSTSIANHDAHGRGPHAPEASVIVPLFGRVDLLEHQLVQWTADEALRKCELIYVLDSPGRHRARAQPCRTAVRALRAAVPGRHALGECRVNGARNIGASIATSRRLLFLDSDVLPTQPGWLPRLCDALESRPETPAVGPKLIYNDDAIQHAGLVYERVVGGGDWSLQHRFKGLHRETPSANIPGPYGADRRVPARRRRVVPGGRRPQLVIRAGRL